MKRNLIGGLVMALMFAHAADAPVATGITEPFLHVTLSASVPGILTVKHFKEGDFVKEGQPILELDKKLEELEAARRTVIANEKKADFDSTTTVFNKTKSVSNDDLIKKESDYKVAAAERDIAAEQLRRRHIVAPFAGQVTEILLETGEACQPYQPLVRLVDTSRCYFVSNLEAKQAARLKPDQSVKLEVDTGGKAVTVTGKLIFISPVVDPGSGLVRVRAVFDNADNKVRPGLTAKMTLE